MANVSPLSTTRTLTVSAKSRIELSSISITFCIGSEILTLLPSLCVRKMTFCMDFTHSLALAELSALNWYVLSSVVTRKITSSSAAFLLSTISAETAYCRLIRFLGCHASFVEYTGPHHCADSSVSVSSAIPTSPHVAEADTVVLGSSFVEPSSVSNFVLSVNQKYIHVLPSRKAVPQIGSFCGEAHYFGLFTPLLIDITWTRRFCHSANAVS